MSTCKSSDNTCIIFLIHNPLLCPNLTAPEFLLASVLVIFFFIFLSSAIPRYRISSSHSDSVLPFMNSFLHPPSSLSILSLIRIHYLARPLFPSLLTFFFSQHLLFLVILLSVSLIVFFASFCLILSLLIHTPFPYSVSLISPVSTTFLHPPHSLSFLLIPLFTHSFIFTPSSHLLLLLFFSLHPFHLLFSSPPLFPPSLLLPPRSFHFPPSFVPSAFTPSPFHGVGSISYTLCAFLPSSLIVHRSLLLSFSPFTPPFPCTPSRLFIPLHHHLLHLPSHLSR